MDVTDAPKGRWIVLDDAEATIIVAKSVLSSFEAEVSRCGFRSGHARLSWADERPVIRVGSEEPGDARDLQVIEVDGCSIAIAPKEASSISERIDEGSAHFRASPEKSFVVIPLDNLFMVVELSAALRLSQRLEELG